MNCSGKIIMIEKLNEDKVLWLEHHDKKSMAPLQKGIKYSLSGLGNIVNIQDEKSRIKSFYSLINNVTKFYGTNDNEIISDVIEKNELNNKIYDNFIENKKNVDYFYILNNTGNELFYILNTKNNNKENFIIPNNLIFSNKKWLSETVDNLYNEVRVHGFVNFELYGIYLDYIDNIDYLPAEKNLNKRFEKYVDILINYIINKKYFKYSFVNNKEKENCLFKIENLFLKNNNNFLKNQIIKEILNILKKEKSVFNWKKDPSINYNEKEDFFEFLKKFKNSLVFDNQIENIKDFSALYMKNLKNNFKTAEDFEIKKEINEIIRNKINLKQTSSIF